jgi:ElaB/YqjD/DUF883 family membrane-anchored ribosome-binding protein
LASDGRSAISRCGNDAKEPTMSALTTEQPPTTATHDPRTGEDLMSRVVTGAHHTIDRLAESAAPQVERLQEAGAKVGVRAEHLRELGDEWVEGLRTTVRENPMTSLAVALAAGVVLARVVR